MRINAAGKMFIVIKANIRLYIFFPVLFTETHTENKILINAFFFFWIFSLSGRDG